MIETFRTIKNWFRVNFNKYHWEVIKTAITCWPWDEYYYLKLTRARFLEMAHYFETRGIAVSSMRNAEYLRLLAKLSDIIAEDDQLYTYVYETTDGDWIELEKLESGLFKVISDRGKYKCLVKVNLKNIDRFVTDSQERNYVENNPHELYKLKAEKLYFKILERHLHEFWD